MQHLHGRAFRNVMQLFTILYTFKRFAFNLRQAKGEAYRDK